MKGDKLLQKNDQSDASNIADSPRDDLNPIANIISTLAEHYDREPGFMRTGMGFQVLHADWPAYPEGEGLRSALETMADFPLGTVFRRIDNIDLCSLFIAEDGRKGDLFDKGR